MTRRDIKKYSLDFEKTFSYFVDHVQCGKTLSKKIIEQIDFHKGIFFTYLPLNVDLDKIFQFSYGGIIQPTSYTNKVFQLQGHIEGFNPKQVVTMDFECSEFISCYTKEFYCNYAIIENYMLEPEDFHANIKNVKMIPYEKEVYYFLDNKNSTKEIYETIRKSGEVWHSLAVLTEIENTLPASLNNDVLNQICKNIKFVIAGAYDGEGYVFWKKQINACDIGF